MNQKKINRFYFLLILLWQILHFNIFILNVPNVSISWSMLPLQVIDISAILKACEEKNRVRMGEK